MSIIGDNIRALRKMQGITQKQLADIADVTRETVNKWETGAIANVRAGNFNRIREHFHLSVDDLRSESIGLSAQLAAQGEPPDGVGSVARTQVPILRPDDLCSGFLSDYPPDYVEVPAGVHLNHPRSFAFVADDSMNCVLPEGCHAIADPDIEADTDAIVLADATDGGPSPVLRRLRKGGNKALLTAESYTRHEEDIVMDLHDVHVIATVVWYQPAAEL